MNLFWLLKNLSNDVDRKKEFFIHPPYNSTRIYVYNNYKNNKYRN